jgi:hypothetical protein
MKTRDDGTIKTQVRSACAKLASGGCGTGGGAADTLALGYSIYGLSVGSRTGPRASAPPRIWLPPFLLFARSGR